MARVAALVLALAALVVAGCGGAEDATPTPETVIGEIPTGSEDGGGTGEGDPAAGKEVFASAGCGSCHTLSDAGATGTVGPSLDESSVDFAAAQDADHERRRRHAGLQRHAERGGDRQRGRLRRLRAAADPSRRIPARGRRPRLRPRPDADLGGRRAAAAHEGRDRPGPRRRDPRDRRHGPHVPLGAAVRWRRRASTTRSSATRAPSSPTRAPASSCATSRSRSSSPARRSPSSRTRASTSTATSTTSSTSPRRHRRPSATPASRTSRCTRSATSPRGSRRRRRSSSRSTTPTSSTGSRRG